MEPWRDPEPRPRRVREQASAGVGVDAIIIETQTSLEELGLAIEAAKRAGAPCVIGSLAFDVLNDGSDLKTMMGIDPEQSAAFLRDAGADVAALNCGSGVDVAWAARVVKRYRAVCDLPTMAQPNAGLPSRKMKVVYKRRPARWRETPGFSSRTCASPADAAARRRITSALREAVDAAHGKESGEDANCRENRDGALLPPGRPDGSRIGANHADAYLKAFAVDLADRKVIMKRKGAQDHAPIGERKGEAHAPARAGDAKAILLKRSEAAAARARGFHRTEAFSISGLKEPEHEAQGSRPDGDGAAAAAALPVMCQLTKATRSSHGVHPVGYFTDDDVWAECLLHMRDHYDCAAHPLPLPGRVHGILGLAERVDRDAPTTLHLHDGARISARDDDAYYSRPRASSDPA
jgi:hypothetical protein